MNKSNGTHIQIYEYGKFKYTHMCVYVFSVCFHNHDGFRFACVYLSVEERQDICFEEAWLPLHDDLPAPQGWLPHGGEWSLVSIHCQGQQFVLLGDGPVYHALAANAAAKLEGPSGTELGRCCLSRFSWQKHPWSLRSCKASLRFQQPWQRPEPRWPFLSQVPARWLCCQRCALTLPQWLTAGAWAVPRGSADLPANASEHAG